MKPNSTHAFVNQLLVCTLVLVCATGGVGVGTVWLRHQISVSANASKALEAQLQTINRRLDIVNADVGREQSWEALMRRNDQWKLGLEIAQERTQIRRVNVDVAARLAAKRNGSFLTDTGAPEGRRLVLGGSP